MCPSSLLSGCNCTLQIQVLDIGYSLALDSWTGFICTNNLFNVLLSLDPSVLIQYASGKKCDPIKERNVEIEKIMEVLNLC
jgi:hypothetical protein